MAQPAEGRRAGPLFFQSKVAQPAEGRRAGPLFFQSKVAQPAEGRRAGPLFFQSKVAQPAEGRRAGPLRLCVTIDGVSLPGLDAHPHARTVLAPALRFLEGEEAPAGGRGGGRGPNHAYLFHGPPGVGKRTVARAFAAALLAAGSPAPDEVRGRVARGAHPDLTWVTPSGAGEMLVGDVDQAVVAAAARTPFESRRRVFVLEDAHTLNDQAANRLLKTLEEPPSFAHLILLAPTPRELLPTIASRCQQVRFDPLPPARIEERLREETPGD